MSQINQLYGKTVPNNAPFINDESIESYKLYKNADYHLEYNESKMFVQGICIKHFDQSVIMPYLEICEGDIELYKANRFVASALNSVGNMYMPLVQNVSTPYLMQCRGNMFFGKVQEYESYRLQAMQNLSLPYAKEIVLTRLLRGDIYALRAKKIYLNCDYKGTVHCPADAEVIGLSAENGRVKRFMTHVDAMRYSLKFFER